MKRNDFYKKINSLNKLLYKYRYYIIAVYFFLSVAFFSIQFDLLRNWDMLVRILNSNYLFHNGNYFEPQRALLESFFIGIFSFLFGSYSVFAFIIFFTFLFFLAVYFFSRSFEVEYAILLSILLNPFFLFYAIKNGSELPMYSFIIFFISFVKLKKPIAGVFLALAFVSKYDSLFMLPITLFLIDRKYIDSAKRIVLFLFFTMLALTPFFAYNIILYHDPIFTFLMSFAKNSPSISSFQVPAYNYFYYGFYELLSVLPIIAIVIIFNRKIMQTIKRKKREFSILAMLIFLAFLVYFLASGLYVHGLGYYRFFLLVTISVTLALSLLTKKEMLLIAVIFFAISLIIAYHILLSQNFNVHTISNEVNSAKQLLLQKYGKDNCTVQSNDWVYLDYYGISATYIRGLNYSEYPLISFGKLPGNYTLWNESGGVYLYTSGISSSKCIFTPVIDFQYGVNYYINISKENNSIGCYFLNEKIKDGFVLSSCLAIMKAFK